jgi:hypothetical protein
MDKEKDKKELSEKDKKVIDKWILISGTMLLILVAAAFIVPKRLRSAESSSELIFWIIYGIALLVFSVFVLPKAIKVRNKMKKKYPR